MLKTTSSSLARFLVWTLKPYNRRFPYWRGFHVEPALQVTKPLTIQCTKKKHLAVCVTLRQHQVWFYCLCGVVLIVSCEFCLGSWVSSQFSITFCYAKCPFRCEWVCVHGAVPSTMTWPEWSHWRWTIERTNEWMNELMLPHFNLCPYLMMSSLCPR